MINLDSPLDDELEQLRELCDFRGFVMSRPCKSGATFSCFRVFVATGNQVVVESLTAFHSASHSSKVN
jgi:hypothetical protein